MNATIRPSAPSSSAIATMPLAPPAISPRHAVGRSSRVMCDISRPAPSDTPRVPAVTRSTGAQSCPTALSVSASTETPSDTPISACAAIMPSWGSASGARWASVSA